LTADRLTNWRSLLKQIVLFSWRSFFSDTFNEQRFQSKGKLQETAMAATEQKYKLFLFLRSLTERDELLVDLQHCTLYLFFFTKKLPQKTSCIVSFCKHLFLFFFWGFELSLFYLTTSISSTFVDSTVEKKQRNSPFWSMELQSL